jgi:hypothetical protein
MRTISLAVATALLVLFVHGCSSSSKSTPPDDDHTKELKKIDSLVTTQSDYNDTLNVLFTHLDSTVAKDSLVKILLADPNVQMAQSSSQGIAIKYTNGMRGGILFDPKDGEEVAGKGSEFKLNSYYGGDPGPGHKPSSKGTIFLNPSYWQRQHWADPLVAKANASFAKTGYNNFEVFTNAQCTVDKFTSLSGYGVVHIYTHGWAWPDDNNITEVYMLTGEAYSAATTTKYLSEIQSGKILMGTDHGANHYWLSPSFFAHYNNFSDDTTLFYGGFCYSGLGGWKDTLIQVAKAGAYVGFDWHVFTNWNAAWGRHMYTHMSDTSLARPMPLAEWRSADPDTDNTYLDNEPGCQKYVSVWNYGYADLVLWRALKILGIDPPAAQVGVLVKVRGTGFGNSEGTSTITFGGVIATPTTWSDTLIVTAVPQGTTGGPVIVTVGENHSNSFPFNLATVSISIDADTVHLLPYDTTHFRATITGTSDTAVTWEVLESIPKWPDVKAGNFYSRGPNLTNFWVSANFVGICHAVASAHADPTKKDTVTVVVSIMDKLRQTPFFYLRFDGKMIYSVNCAGTNYDFPTTLQGWNSQSNGMPALLWEGNQFSINGTAVWGEWPYHDSLVVSGTMSELGDTLLSFKMFYRHWGYDGGLYPPYGYREFRTSVEAANIPLESFTYQTHPGWSSDVNISRYELEGAGLQSHIIRFEHFHHESLSDGSCWYERVATTADWNSTSPTPDLQINFDVQKTNVRGIGNDSTVVRERGAKQTAK